MPVTGQPAQTRAQAISSVAAKLDQDYPGYVINDSAYPGATLGDQWSGYANKHPDTGVSELETAFAVIVGLEKVKGALVLASQATAAGVGQVAQAAGTGLTKAIPKIPGLTGIAAIGDFFSKLGEANTWIRVGEFVLGVGLIIVGLSKLVANTSVGRAATKVGKAAALL